MTLPTQTPATPDHAAIKGRQRQVGASGDDHVIASITVPVGERLCDAVDLRAGERVLDVATVGGNTAIAAARRLCDVSSRTGRARVRRPGVCSSRRAAIHTIIA